jgi:hypothetical protein
MGDWVGGGIEAELGFLGGGDDLPVIAFFLIGAC